MTNSHTTVLDDIDLPQIPPGMLAGANRRQRSDKLHESIPGEYYYRRDGTVAYAEGSTTAQGKRLMLVKGWKRIQGSPRVHVLAEHDARFHALLRSKDGPSRFPVEQIIEYKWHKNPPMMMTCREPLDDDLHPEHTLECFKVVRFPQLRGLEIEEATCNICKRYYASVSGSEMMPAEIQLKKHMEVSHTRQMVNRELVTGLAEALRAGGGFNAMTGTGGAPGAMTPEAVAQIAAQVALTVIQNMGANLTAAVTPNEEPVGEEGDEDEEEPGAVPPPGKRLKDFNKAELIAYAAERDISLEGCETNQEMLDRIRTVQNRSQA